MKNLTSTLTQVKIHTSEMFNLLDQATLQSDSLVVFSE